MRHRSAITNVPLATGVLFFVMQTFFTVAVARALMFRESVSQSSGERGAWVFFSAVLFLFSASEWLGFGFLTGPAFNWRVRAAREPPGKVQSLGGPGANKCFPLPFLDEALDVWRGERFLAITTFTALASLLFFSLAAAKVVALRNALTVAGSFAGPLPVLWASSLGPYYTRPPKHLFAGEKTVLQK